MKILLLSSSGSLITLRLGARPSSSDSLSDMYKNGQASEKGSLACASFGGLGKSFGGRESLREVGIEVLVEEGIVYEEDGCSENVYRGVKE